MKLNDINNAGAKIKAPDLTLFICKQCASETETLNEGHCEDCRVENQNRLDRHNFEFDAWEKLSSNERKSRIKSACITIG